LWLLKNSSHCFHPYQPEYSKNYNILQQLKLCRILSTFMFTSLHMFYNMCISTSAFLQMFSAVPVLLVTHGLQLIVRPTSTLLVEERQRRHLARMGQARHGILS
jgi:hypothetical protein